MPLRCLLFTSDEAIVEPISQVLHELGVEAEHCQNSVDAVERITTQLFQIVITDWQDQPEAAFLLKTTRDLKAGARPLTLAVVTEDTRPQALQNGANSVLLKPIRAEQARDTLGTACELLKAKMQPHVAPVTSHPAPSSSFAAAAPKLAPASITQAPEKIRAGEILHSAASSPGGQFETEVEKINSEDAPIADRVEAAPDLISAAASVQAEAEPQPESAAAVPLTGWAALQARLTKPITFGSPSTPKPRNETPSSPTENPKSELLGYDNPVATKPWRQDEESKTINESDAETEESSAEKFVSYAESSISEARGKKLSHFVLVAAILTIVVLALVPRSRLTLKTLYGNGLRAGLRWLNPPPAALPPTVTQHDSFGQAGDEYKLPAVTPVPDATTDPSQINVVPVIDPTAKQDKNAQVSDAQPQVIDAGSPSSGSGDQNSTGTATASQTTQTPQNQVATNQSSPAADSAAASSTNPLAAPTPVEVPSVQPTPAQMAPQPTLPKPSSPPQRAPQPVHSVSASQMAGIPSSLRTHIAASTTPESVAPKGPDTSLSSIEPVSLPESSLRQLLAQSVDPQYPAVAKAGGQKGSVILQVLIGRDGTVQDAKFMQGSFLFARSAIEAVKQWQFKPYSMNGRPVSVQSTITLYFKPPA